MNRAIEIKGVSKSYGREVFGLGGRLELEETHVLINLNIGIEKGKVTALIGGNGSGKSTIFNIVCGYLKPDKGNIDLSVDGKIINLRTLKPYEIVRLGVGRMFQDPHIFSNLTLLENMYLGDELRWSEYPLVSWLKFRKHLQLEQKRIEEVEDLFMRLFGLNNSFWTKRNDLAGSLSYGQQRLLALARLFMNSNLRVILLDEPCAGVSSEIIEKIKMIIASFVSDGKTVFLIEHNVDFVRATADTCYLLEGGMVKKHGNVNMVIEKYLNLDSLLAD